MKQKNYPSSAFFLPLISERSADIAGCFQQAQGHSQYLWDGSAQLGHAELVTDGALVILGAAGHLQEHRGG